MKNTSNKYAALLKDTMLFALSAYLPKLISFFLVPVYTSCLTTYEYGVVDLIATTISFLVYTTHDSGFGRKRSSQIDFSMLQSRTDDQ